MRIINLIFDMPAEIGPIAITNEFNATRIKVDTSGILDDHPNAHFSIHYRRPYPDKTSYPAAIQQHADADGILIYDLTETDTCVPGDARFTVWAHDGNDALIKSCEYILPIKDDVYSSSPIPPDLDWANEVLEARDRAEAAVEKLTSVEVSAEQLPEGSNPTVERTETETGIALAFGIPKGDKGDIGNVMFAVFDVDDDGELIMITPDGYTGPEFEINDDGEMEAVING